MFHYLLADNAKSLINVWRGITDLLEKYKKIGIIVPVNNCQAVNIYDSYFTGKIFEKLFKKKKKLLIEAYDKINKHKIKDFLHFLPVATHLKGKASLPRKAIERDLMNIRDHLEGGWHVIILRHPLYEVQDRFLDQIERLPQLETTIHGYVEFNEQQNKQVPKIANQAHFIKWMLHQMIQNYQKAERESVSQKNIELNLPDAPKEVPFSGTYFLKRYFLADLDGKDIERDYGQFWMKFSPSYNIRITAPNEEGLDFVCKHLALHSCQKYNDLVKLSPAKIFSQRKSKLVASVIFHEVYRLFRDVFHIPLSTVEHYYRYTFISAKYALKSAQTILEHKEQQLRTGREKYIDLQLMRGAFIMYNQQEMTIKQFIEGQHYRSTLMKKRNEAHSILRKGETIIIEERNILDPLVKMHKELKNQNLSRKTLQPLKILFPYGEHHITRDISRYVELKLCLTAIAQYNYDPHHTNLVHSIHQLIEYFYKSLSYAIISFYKDNFHADSIHDGNATKDLREFSKGLYKYLNQLLINNQKQTSNDRSLFVFNIWFYQQLAIISFFKGNFFLFQLIQEVFANHRRRIQRDESDIFAKLLPLTSLQELLSADNYLTTAQKYLYTYNQIVLLPANTLVELVEQIRSEQITAVSVKFFKQTFKRIAAFSLHQANLDISEVFLLNFTGQQLEDLCDYNLSDPDALNFAKNCLADCDKLVEFLGDISFVRKFVDVFGPLKKKEDSCWDTLHRVISFRDSFTIRNIIENLIEKEEFVQLANLFALNFVSPAFIEASVPAEYLSEFNLCPSAFTEVEAMFKYFLVE